MALNSVGSLCSLVYWLYKDRREFKSYGLCRVKMSVFRGSRLLNVRALIRLIKGTLGRRDIIRRTILAIIATPCLSNFVFLT